MNCTATQPSPQKPAGCRHSPATRREWIGQFDGLPRVRLHGTFTQSSRGWGKFFIMIVYEVVYMRVCDMQVYSICAHNYDILYRSTYIMGLTPQAWNLVQLTPFLTPAMFASRFGSRQLHGSSRMRGFRHAAFPFTDSFTAASRTFTEPCF